MDSENSFSSNVHKIDQFFFTHQKEDDYISYQEDEEQSEQEYKGRKRRKGTFPFDRLLYKCEWSDCPFSTKSIAKFYNHEYTHVQEQIAVNSFECRWNQCQFVAKDSNELNMHFSYHPYLQRLMAIGELTKEIRNLPDCQLPYRSIIPENLAWFCCKWADCMYAFLRLNDFILHVTLGHVSITRNDSKKSSGKKNKDKNNGEDELNENNGKRKYLCEWRECGVCCNSYFGLVSHVRTHTTERRVACSDCGSTFVSREVFQDHIDRQVKFEEEDLTSRKEGFRCAACLKVLSSYRLLRQHIRGHINNVKCHLCEMTLPSRSMLKRHIRYRHSTERPYKCSQCEQTTVTRCDLTKHMKIHQIVNPYKCKYCEFQCRSIIGFRSHMTKSHDDVVKPRIYACHYCPKLFENRGGLLTQHLVRVHQLKWPSGRSRFQYKLDPQDGYYRIHMMRFVTTEVSQQMNPGGDVIACTDSETPAFTESEQSVDDSYYEDDKRTVRSDEVISTGDDASFFLIASESSNNY